jgi:hemerythrin superfamily protein
MDAITLLKKDHKEIEQLFRSYERLGADRAAAKNKQRIVARVIKELSVHAAAEEEVLYPMARKKFAKHGTVHTNGRMTEDEVLEALEEHHIVKILLAELEHMNPTDVRYDAKMRVLMMNFRFHVEEEEGKLFPDLRRVYSKQQLVDMGARIERAKKIAPTHPHPWAPDVPPGNIIAGMPTAMLDRARDAGKALFGRVAINGARRVAHSRKATKAATTKVAAKARKIVSSVSPKRHNGQHAHR